MVPGRFTEGPRTLLYAKVTIQERGPLGACSACFMALPNGTWTETGGLPDGCRPIFGPARDAPGSSLDPARDLIAARPNCKSRSAPYRKPHGSRRETDRAPGGSLTEDGRQGDQNRRTLGAMTPAGVYAEDMPNGHRFKCDLSINWSRRLPFNHYCLVPVGQESL
ncbi:hypothetical protein Bbelb_282250 [Branchiostoma belcheri]|nr:hypothetical protein Bbelb_282250 [Branchiostoma belcheri]